MEGSDNSGDEQREETNRRKRLKMSKVWDHFILKENVVACVHCKIELAYHNSTSSMLQHLNRKHPLYSETGGPSPGTR